MNNEFNINIMAIKYESLLGVLFSNIEKYQLIKPH